MANDYVDRLETVFNTFLGCADSGGRILDIEEFAYIINKMEEEIE